MWYYQCFLFRVKPDYEWWLERHSTVLSIKYFWLGVLPTDENMTIPLTDCLNHMSYRSFAVKMIVARRDGESPATRFSTFFMAPALQHPHGYYLRASFYFVSCSFSSSCFPLFYILLWSFPCRFYHVRKFVASTCQCIFCDKNNIFF